MLQITTGREDEQINYPNKKTAPGAVYRYDVG